MGKLRKCKGRASTYVNGKWESIDFELGYFHHWGINYEELRDGIGHYTVAIVELPDGRVVMPVADEITFLPEKNKFFSEMDEEDSDEEDSDEEDGDDGDLGDRQEDCAYSEKDMCPFDPDDERVDGCPHYLMGLCSNDSHCPI